MSYFPPWLCIRTTESRTSYRTARNSFLRVGIFPNFSDRSQNGSKPRNFFVGPARASGLGGASESPAYYPIAHRRSRPSGQFLTSNPEKGSSLAKGDAARSACYPDRVNSSSHPRRFSVGRWHVAALLVLLGGIAIFMSMRPRTVVTVSGLDLTWSRTEVIEAMGKPNYQDGTPPTQLEYWSDPVTEAPSLSITFNAAGQMIRLRGGKPQIDGKDVRGLTLAHIETALGPAAGAGRGREFTSGGQAAARVESDSFLKYPDRHLLVLRNAEAGTEFILFAGTREP